MGWIYQYVKKWLTQPFTLLTSLKGRMLFAAGMLLFGFLFLTLFVPFNISEWIVYTSPFKRLEYPGLALICGVIFFLSQLIQYKIFSGQQQKNYHLLSGFVFDTLFATLPLSILYSIPANSFMVEFGQTLKIIILFLALWYLIGLSLFALARQKREKTGITGVASAVTPAVDHINFYNEHGQLRLAVKLADLLFIESADNYIIVYIRSEGRTAREMVRTSLKIIEAGLVKHQCIRCHRSYIVNLHNASSIRKDGRTHCITIQGTNHTIPISRGYIKVVKDTLGA